MVQCLELTIGEQFPPAKTVLHGYLHFEALTSHEYEYSCVTCGDHPPIVIMDLHRKGAFNMSCKCVGMDTLVGICFEQIIHSGRFDTACANLATAGLYPMFSIIQVILLIFLLCVCC